MNEHAGPACALSVLIVAIFAVLLHERTPPASALPPLTQKSSTANDSRHSPKPVLEPPAAKRDQPLASTLPRPAVARTDDKANTTKGEKVRPVARVAASPPKPLATSPTPLIETARKAAPEPIHVIPVRSAFTVVRAGETLTDVATRVYGSADSTETLWKANRDQVALIDSVLARGTLLRTP